MSSADGVYVFDRPTSNQVSPPFRCETVAGYTFPFVRLVLEAEEDKLRGHVRLGDAAMHLRNTLECNDNFWKQ
ncbi:hypothetical protein A2U01_0033891, partial [Trifolium medium]|nr:hypothetical protein [Trifolium medium]